ncbi:MAG: ABC transporter ATP-binding protein [Ruminococcaceae bacterium]|nr:ABC transporter ATP-binding protein [Oscillospiraceae bacterium]HHV32488.1 ABC transporter ATP-binding protein [Clostridiales bacterium]
MSRIEISHLTKTFGKTKALTDVSLEFESGHIYGLLGRNGAGKTTLLNLITGRLFPDSGEITVDGEPVLENDRALSKIYCMTEGSKYPDRMRVVDALSWSAEFYPNFGGKYARSLCKKFDLNEFQKIGGLSTGYTSIFKLIIALACGSEFVLLDEPVLGLDANHRELFYRELIENFSSSQRCFILSTHLIEEAATLIDRIIIVKNGTILLNEDAQDILESGCTVSGPADLVDRYVQGKKLIGSDKLGGLKSAYLMEPCTHVPDGLTVGTLDLQKLFIQLTNA